MSPVCRILLNLSTKPCLALNENRILIPFSILDEGEVGLVSLVDSPRALFGATTSLKGGGEADGERDYTMLQYQTLSIWLGIQFRQRNGQIKDRKPNILLNIFGLA